MGGNSFVGYRRPDGRYGVRNHLAVISSVGCANEVTRRVAQEVGGAPVTHGQGCCQLPSDLETVRRALGGIGWNPNVGAVLVVGLGCEGVPPRDLATDIAASGKPVAVVVLQEAGGYTRAVAQGIEIGRRLNRSIQDQQREEVDASHLAIGIKCGASDATSGLVSNPATGVASDMIVAAGGTSVFCETTELIGAEHIIAARAVTPEVGEQLLEAVRRLEQEVLRSGMDMRGGNPSPGNIAGGISSIEEKSLGAVCKAGLSPLTSVLQYGERPDRPGLHFMDSPGREMEVFAGLAASGTQLMLFTTGRGAPQGFPIAPVIKISANAGTCAFLAEHIDLDISGVLARTQTLIEAGEGIFRKILAVASGEQTKAEILGYTETMDIHTYGPAI
jgi:altronate dehydratase large subunit